MKVKIGDLIALRALPTVVQLEEVMREREQVPPAALSTSSGLTKNLRELVRSYLIVEGANRAAFETIANSLSAPDRNGDGFFVSGAYGTGKTHLLALLGLLAESEEARQVFFSAYPEYEPLGDALTKRRLLVVYLSLDAYCAQRTRLEDALWQATIAELKRHKHSFDAPSVQVDSAQMPPSRAEGFLRLQESLSAVNLEGVLWLIDELALFLSACQPRDLQNDASFLQFLGQRTQVAPFWVVATIQKGLEDIGELEPYSLTQIRDRYKKRLTLSFAHAHLLVGRNLIVKKDPQRFEAVIRELHRHWLNSFPNLTIGVYELLDSYPLHPTTLALLERCTAMFFSRNRSIVDFVQTHSQKALEANFTHLITPDAIYDHFQSDILQHPELRVYAERIIPYFEQNAKRFSPEEPERVVSLIKSLLVFHIAGREATVSELTNALLWEMGLGGEANYSYTLALLETLRTQGNYIVCLRRAPHFGDVYDVDIGATLNEMVVRRLNAVTSGLSETDARILGYAWNCCREEEFELPPLSSPRTYRVEWLNTERHLLVQGGDLRRVSEQELLNIVELLSSPACGEDAQVFIAEPFHLGEQHEHFRQVLASLPASRWQSGVCALLPRELNGAEVFRLRENTAAQLLLKDPTLQDSELGMAILQRLQEDAPSRAAETRRIMKAAYFQGELLLADPAPRTMPVSALVDESADTQILLRRVAETILPLIFPRFKQLAPREHFPAGRMANQLAQALLTGNLKGLTDPTLQRWLRTVALPLGVCQLTQEGFRLALTRADLARLVAEQFAGGAPLSYTEIETALAKTEYGLPPPTTQLLVAALLSLGELTATEASGAPLPPRRIVTPFEKSRLFLTISSAVSEQTWEGIGALLNALGMELPEERPSVSAQHRLWQSILNFQNHTVAELEDIKARLVQFTSNLNQRQAQWKRSWESIEVVSRMLLAIDENLPAYKGLPELLNRLASGDVSAQRLSSAWRIFTTLRQFFREFSERVLTIYNYLNHPGLAVRDEAMAQSRMELMTLIAQGEELVASWQVLEEKWRLFLEEYRQAYIVYHEEVHASARFEPYERLRRSEAYRLLERLAELRTAAMPVISQISQAAAALSEALLRQCPEATESLRSALIHAPVCHRCYLQLGQPLPLEAVEEVADKLSAAVASGKAFLSSEKTRDVILRYAHSLPHGVVRQRLEQLRRLPQDADDVEWLGFLTEEMLFHLNTALLPVPTVMRDLQGLSQVLEEKVLSKSEAVNEFVRWLDTPTPLKAGDRIKFLKGRL